MMSFRLFSTTSLLLLLSLQPPNASALTLKQFSEICHSAAGECGDHPIIRAYVGGALDLLAILDEKTDCLDRVYCKRTQGLFDVSRIVLFMDQRSEQNASDNAMLWLVRYLEEKGGCD